MPHHASVVKQAAQCVGAILIAPLIKKFPTRTILSSAILFGLTSIILLIVDAAIGTYLRSVVYYLLSFQAMSSRRGQRTDVLLRKLEFKFGALSPGYTFMIFWLVYRSSLLGLSGIAYGMVKFIRRVM